MSDGLALDEVSLAEATSSLRRAINALREAETGTKFSFQSVTGIAEVACRFLAELDQSLIHLISQAAKGADVVTVVTDEATMVDQQLARVSSAGFGVPEEGR